MGPKRLRPFLRWAGGKQNLVQHLVDHVPQGVLENGATYYEPFLGAGALFLALKPKRAVLADANRHLIECFRAIKDHPDGMNRNLRAHERNSSKDYYYDIRGEFNRANGQATVAQAARFLYLNRACYNGIYRVNLKGEFNVPFGDKQNLLFPNLSQLRMLAARLNRARVSVASFEQTADTAMEGDFVYLDPPYPPLNGSSYFAHYTKDRFDFADQSNVAEAANHMSDRGCRVMVSNADMPIIRRLYKGWRIRPIEVTRFVSCKAVRHKVDELIMTNY